ncbi:GntR family transcriptional regulator [Mycoplasma todarodis]|uniref:GntR family transcriptional regulator n=1 Tax=Mycoplasma todarodis TaxID=1937191 RepID=UPI003B31B36B
MYTTMKNYILRYLLLKIQNLEFKVGDKLPSEQFLAIKFDCNRHTARSALEILKKAQLISNNNGVGNFVVNNMDKMFGMKHLISSDDIEFKRIDKKQMPISFLNYIDGEKTLFQETYKHRNRIIAKSYTIIDKDIQGDIDAENQLPKLLAYNGVCIFEVEEKLEFQSEPHYVEWKSEDVVTITQKYMGQDGKVIGWVLTNLDILFYKKTKNFKI